MVAFPTPTFVQQALTLRHRYPNRPCGLCHTRSDSAPSSSRGTTRRALDGASLEGRIGDETIASIEPFQISLARYEAQTRVEVWAESRRAGYAMVLISFDEEEVLSMRTFGEDEARVFGRAGMDPERWEFDELATRVVGSVERPTPGTIGLRLEAEFREGQSIRVSVQLIH